MPSCIKQLGLTVDVSYLSTYFVDAARIIIFGGKLHTQSNITEK